MVDAPDSKSGEGNLMWVRVPPPVHRTISANYIVSSITSGCPGKLRGVGGGIVERVGSKSASLEAFGAGGIGLSGCGYGQSAKADGLIAFLGE